MSDSAAEARLLYDEAKKVAGSDSRACLKFLLQAYEKDPKKKYMDKIVHLREHIEADDESQSSDSSDDIILTSKYFFLFLF